MIIHGELYSSKNSKQIRKLRNGKSILTKSDACLNNEKALMWQLIGKRLEFEKMKQGKEKPYRISFKIYRKTKRVFDYINISQNLQDCMVKVGMLDDDNANEMIPVFEQYEVDKENPRVEIKIL